MTGLNLIVEEADGEDVLVLRHSIGHGKVSQRVPQQQHVGSSLQPSETRHMWESTISLVERVDQWTFEGPQEPLLKDSTNWRTDATH